MHHNSFSLVLFSSFIVLSWTWERNSFWYAFGKVTGILLVVPLDLAITPMRVLQDPLIGAECRAMFEEGEVDDRFLMLLFLTVERLRKSSTWKPYVLNHLVELSVLWFLVGCIYLCQRNYYQVFWHASHHLWESTVVHRWGAFRAEGNYIVSGIRIAGTNSPTVRMVNCLHAAFNVCHQIKTEDRRKWDYYWHKNSCFMVLFKVAIW